MFNWLRSAMADRLMATVVLSCASWALWDLRVLPRGNIFNGRIGSRTGTRDVICDVISLDNGSVLPYPLARFTTGTLSQACQS